MFDILAVPYDRWSGYDREPGNSYTGKRRGVVCHHPYPHAVTPGAGLDVEIRELREIDSYHRKKWQGIGYHFVISQSGRIFIGRGSNRIGAHSPGQNTTTYGVAYLVDGMKDVPTAAAMTATDHLVAELIAKGRLDKNYSVEMHGDRQNTSCPGPAAAKFLRAYAWPHVSAPPPVTQDRRILKEGMRGEDVRQVQRALLMEDRHQTGYFGPITAQAVRVFQASYDLMVDGIVGPNTYAKLFG